MIEPEAIGPHSGAVLRTPESKASFLLAFVASGAAQALEIERFDCRVERRMVGLFHGFGKNRSTLNSTFSGACLPIF